jgi:hypothetical protein
MEFIAAAQEASFAALAVYVVFFVLAHLFNWRRFDPRAMLGLVVGCVVGAGLVAQFELAGIVRYLAYGAAVGAGIWLFQWLGRRFPLQARS